MCHLRWFCSLLALAFVGAAWAADTKKDTDKPPAKEKLESAGKMLGELTAIEPESTRNFTIKAYYPEIDKNKYQDLQRYIAQQTAEISRIRNPNDKQNRLVRFQAEVAKRQADMYKKSSKDLQLQGVDELKVRTKILPPKVDDNGNHKKYTKKELAELKGPDKKLPGYKATYEDLHKGLIVQVYLVKKAKPKAKTKDKEKEKDSDDKDDEDVGQRTKVSMIVILAEKPEK